MSQICLLPFAAPTGAARRGTIGLVPPAGTRGTYWFILRFSNVPVMCLHTISYTHRKLLIASLLRRHICTKQPVQRFLGCPMISCWDPLGIPKTPARHYISCLDLPQHFPCPCCAALNWKHEPAERKTQNSCCGLGFFSIFNVKTW